MKKYPKNNELKRDVMFTLYINAIGKKSNAIMDEIRESRPWLRNPKILKTNYGSFKVRKYSYLLSPKDFYEIKEFIRNRAIYSHGKEIHYLVEDKQNIFIIDRINF